MKIIKKITNKISKITKYFKNLFNALLGREIEKNDGVVEEEKIYDLFTESNIKRINYLINYLSSREKNKSQLLDEEFIRNRKEMNEYKDWYHRIRQKPEFPEDVKKSLEKNSKLDGYQMDRQLLGLKDIKDMTNKVVSEDKK